MSDREPQIIALGGGGFSDGRDPRLDVYVLEQARVSRPSISFVGTASGDSDRYLANFYSRFVQLDCKPTHLSLFRRAPELREHILAQDVIYVGGGNTKSMLAVWRDWGLPELLREAYLAGAVLAGISAGAICWFEQGVTDSVDGDLGPLDCLGILEGSCCPHYTGEPERRPSYHRLIASGEMRSGIAIDDGAAAHFSGGALKCVVAEREAAGACEVGVAEGAVRESPLSVERL